MATVEPSVDYSPAMWRRQILAHRDPQSIAARTGFVAAAFIDQSNSSSTFVDIESLQVILLYEDEFHPTDERWPQRTPLRFAGYRVSRVPHGVQWGGSANSCLFKDLMLTPQPGARGQRIDRSKVELLSLALKLDRRLSRAARHPAAPWHALRLPRLWAGFQTRYARDLCGEGFEFEDACRNGNESPTTALRTASRTLFGLTLYPLDWVSGELKRATAVFAEVTPTLGRQVFRINQLPDGLVGFQGASAYDFYGSCYRRPYDRTKVIAAQSVVGNSFQSRQSPPPPAIAKVVAQRPMPVVNCVA